MRRIVTTLLLSLVLTTGSGVAFADRTHDRGHDRKEYRPQGNHRPGNGHSGSNRPGNGNHGNNRPGNSQHHDKDKHDDRRPGWGQNNHNNRPPQNSGHSMGRPGFQSGPHHSMTPPPPRPHYHSNLAPMVRHAVRGARDVNIWQIDPETFVVRFRIGNRLYAQYIYPYSGIYGERSLISVNWLPQSPWIPIPPVTLNINI